MALPKQIIAFKEITEKHQPIGTAMMTAGYKKNTAIKPKNLTNSKGWKELMEKYLPDKLLAEKHLEGLHATKGIYRQTEEYTWVKIDEEPDAAVIHKYLDSAYKLKGAYPKGEDVGSKTLILNITGEVAKRYGLISDTSTSADS